MNPGDPTEACPKRVKGCDHRKHQTVNSNLSVCSFYGSPTQPSFLQLETIILNDLLNTLS